MTEGPVTKSKRMGARFFKNPPQPHMCIQDYLEVSGRVCYINVLSWDKIKIKPMDPFDRFRFYGGTKISPPRAENRESVVFFVMANPEVLRQNGKNAQNLKEQASLIKLLLDFVETVNKGVVFQRLYKILDDRDITGELKEIWSIVQNDKAKSHETLEPEEILKPVSQYQHYQDHTQNQQKFQQHQPTPYQQHPQLPQQYHQLSPQQHQHQLKQIQPQHRKSQPSQYHYSYAMMDRRPLDKCDNYDLTYARPNHVENNFQNDHIYQPRPVTSQNNIDYRDRIYEYQFPQLPRPMGPPYPPPNCHPNVNLGCPNMMNPGMLPVNNHAVNPGPQIHYVSMHTLENNVFVELHRMQQPQQPQLQLAHAPPVWRYDTNDAYYDQQAKVKLNFINAAKPLRNAAIKNSSNKRQLNSPTHRNFPNSSGVNENSGKYKSPVKVLQRNVNAIPISKSQILKGSPSNISIEKKIVQVTDLDEDESESHMYDNCDKTENIESNGDVEKSTILPSFTVSTATESHENSSQQSVIALNGFEPNGKTKKRDTTKIMVLKRNNSCNDSGKLTLKDENIMRNDATCNSEAPFNRGIDDKVNEDDNTDDLTTATDENYYNDKKQKNNSSSSTVINNEQSGQINRQTKNNGKGDSAPLYPVYTILKKPESIISQEEVTNQIAQLSMKECTDSSEISAVILS